MREEAGVSRMQRLPGLPRRLHDSQTAVFGLSEEPRGVW